MKKKVGCEIVGDHILFEGEVVGKIIPIAEKFKLDRFIFRLLSIDKGGYLERYPGD